MKRINRSVFTPFVRYGPIGGGLIVRNINWHAHVGFDDADYNLHMSNSSYAKVLDSARFRFAAASFPNIFRSGGWMALAATHFHFIREIPMLSSYEVRTRIGAWDGKWIWCVSRFVKPLPKNARTKSKSGSVLSPGSDPEIESNSEGPDTLSRALLQCASKTTEPDGAMLYCVAVSQLCCKHGRITIPPALVLAANGFYALPKSISKSASATTSNHRACRDTASLPHWPTVRTLAASMPALAKLYLGGWRDVPEGERWWEDALAACEPERLARLVPFVGPVSEETMGVRKGGLTGGLDGVRHLE
ncbi:Peptidase A1 domain-containing protein [Mycena sanguinolenta]|uniref:Peptidase A1 domain-containing protein n=1 Tax=Mycena sanguinolenta TaxID=230812 RepID=A0A8H6ZHC7_9AGAR|nr:Peptidase A1 domain-containing protein [Mycena sanguinolenta]